MADPTKKEEMLIKREQIAERFLAFPLLYFIVRSWLMSWRARIAMVLGVFIFFGIILTIPRVWRVTPKDFTPVVRISILDEAKAIVLERNSKKYLAQGRQDYGIMALHASTTHNMGNISRLRRFLELVAEREANKGVLQLDTINVNALRHATWLRRLSEDPVDIEILARLYDSMEFDDDNLSLLAPAIEEQSVSLKKRFIKALLRQGYIEQFEFLWRKWEASKQWSDDEELQLYRAAATAGFASLEKAQPARELLRQRLLEGPLRITANRLLELVAFQRRDAEEYLACLNRLREWRVDRIQDHCRAWVLLAASNRKDEAVQMADQFNRAPQTPIDTSQLAAAYLELGMHEDAHKLLNQFIERFGFFERLWVQYGKGLAATRNWIDLRNLIAKMRLDPSIAHRMLGYSYYLEGLSELGEGRAAAAHELFQRVTQYGIPNLEVAFTVIDEMRRFGHIDIAARLVEQVETDAKDNPRYWMFVLHLASDTKNDSLMLKAAEEYLRMRPDDTAAKNNFAASLLATRDRATEASRITLELLTSAPDLPALQINHAAALALNKRFQEAQEQLDKVEMHRLSTFERSMYFFVLTEAFVGLGKLHLADAAASKIQDGYLFPRQREALDLWKESIASSKRPKPTTESHSEPVSAESK